MLERYRHIFLLGIKGAAMANIAVILKKMGKSITGSDVDLTFITDNLLNKNAIRWTSGFDPADIPAHTDLIVYSAAHGGKNNPQVVAAEKRGIRSLHQAQFLGELMSDFKTKIAICGCHGKTTTSALLTEALIRLKTHPSYLVGAPSFGTFAGGDFQSKDYFVVEADEYGVNPPSDKTPKFLSLKPDIILCTNIDYDHPDVYASLDETKKAYQQFFDSRKLFLCLDDTVLRSVIPQLGDAHIITYGFDVAAQVRVTSWKTSESGSRFTIETKGKLIGDFTTQLFGKKNILNAAGVIAVLLDQGFGYETIKKSLAFFTGAARRFSLVFEKNNMLLFDDYGHHPSEIKATVEAARDRFPGKRVIVIFQPHTFSRTAVLLDEFSVALAQADESYVLPIFPSAREDASSFTVRSADIEKKARYKNLMNVHNVTSIKALHEELAKELKKNDVILTMGAGDVYETKNGIIKIIENRAL